MSDFTNPPPPPPPVPGGSPGAFPAQPPGAVPVPPPVVVYQYVQPGHTSGFAIASMVLGILWIYWLGSILAVIFGHIAISQASKDPTLRGKGMAIAGLVLGYVGIGTLLLVILVAAAASTS